LEAPLAHSQAIEIDKKNGNMMWHDPETTEMDQLGECKTFMDKEVGREATIGYKRIRYHIIYDVKHYGWHKKNHLVAGGHLTDPNTGGVFSGVISLRGIRLISFLGVLQ
jgi:hypothetical protein